MFNNLDGNYHPAENTMNPRKMLHSPSLKKTALIICFGFRSQKEKDKATPSPLLPKKLWSMETQSED